MKSKGISAKSFIFNFVNAFLLLFVFATALNAQSQQFTPNDDGKAQQIINNAIEKLGGEKYLNVRTAISKGLYSQFREGQAEQISTFIDYISYPDKERTEFKTNKIRYIQTNVGNTGWTFDGASLTIKEMKDDQVNEFRNYTLRTSVEYLLRGFWKKDSAKLEYAGKREAGLGKRNEVVRLVYEDGFSVEFEFNAKGLSVSPTDWFPARVVYKRRVEPSEGEKTDDDGTVKEEVRFGQFVEVNGVMTPNVIDTYRNGKQTARVNFQSIEFNKEIPESLFAKPTNVKEIK